MVKKKVDPRVRGLIEWGVQKNTRSLFVLVGDHGKDQVENLHRLLSKTRVKSRPSVLWCYKKELGFSTHRKKRMKEIKRNQSRGLHDPDRDDPFDLFISSTNIRWTYYKETEKILGQTFGMCVLQDFEAITPNLLARTIETVEGGGIVILLLKTVKSLKQLYTMTMDVHSRFRTEAHHEIIPRFNERFILSLGQCSSCLVLDDELNVLPLSSKMEALPTTVPPEELEAVTRDPKLEELKVSLEDTPNIGSLVGLTKTLDQAQAVMSFLDAISEKTIKSTVALTAARGRGKSASIGLCLAGAISYGYSNVFVTAPSPENLKTVFEFIVSGLNALHYQEHIDYEILSEHSDNIGKVVTRINVFRHQKQTIQYIQPHENHKLSMAELVAIDEAAAIPLPVVRKLLGPYLVFLSSTVNGYEGTGRSLSLKLIQQLRNQQNNAMVAAAQQTGESVSGAKSKKGERQLHEERWKVAADAASSYASSGASSSTRKLIELSLETPIRYSTGDGVEEWLNNLLCLNITKHTSRIGTALPAPKDCQLYMVNRDALFSFHSMAEALLQRIWALYTTAHYKNSPNDLQMLSDAPAHRLFVLLGPQQAADKLPDILCIIQVAFEGKISQKSVMSEMSRGNKASGDMIPWTISQQFNDVEFAGLSGVRVVRISTHPDVQSMGYGSHALDLMINFFQGNLSGQQLPSGEYGVEGALEATISSGTLADEEIAPKAKLPPLLVALEKRPAERVAWIGVSFGLTTQLLNFWSRKGFKVCYLRQTTNELTGEYSCIMLREVETDDVATGWLEGYVSDYRRRLVTLLSYSFAELETPLAITLIDPDKLLTDASATRTYSPSLVTAEELINVHLSLHDLKRLELYSRNMVDHHMIIDTIPILARLVFLGRIASLHLSHLQIAILLSIGLQHRSVDSISAELNLPSSQILAFFNKTIRKLSMCLKELVESHVAKELPSERRIVQMERKALDMRSSELDSSLAEDHRTDAREAQKKTKEYLLENKDVAEYVQTKGTIPKTISIPKSAEKRKAEDAVPSSETKKKKKKHNKQKE